MGKDQENQNLLKEWGQHLGQHGKEHWKVMNRTGLQDKLEGDKAAFG